MKARILEATFYRADSPTWKCEEELAITVENELRGKATRRFLMEEETTCSMWPRLRLIASDFFVSFLWVWSGSLLRCLAFRFLGSGNNPVVLIIKCLVAVPYLVFFAWVGRATKGGSYNPLIVLCYAISGNFTVFLFSVLARIPAQVAGSVVGVWLTNSNFPGALHGPSLNVDIHRGTFTEGFLTFIVVIIVLSLKKKDFGSSAKRVWISSVSKVILHLIGSDITGGIMNPATAFGWAYAEGTHASKEHIYVYWLAPIEATVLGVWACSLLVNPLRLKVHHGKICADFKLD
ncbi:probable aquaporin SIP2-1 [Phalaenopsis equestris]|uniref:probable aquaporin SIP2-1 n=1 Tax=Phalaenopsis equestris TaxID=78828 RepID=UPI0009E3EF39|nr:probable aquaporin SIP2-1 [Phalaenopsis equestris]